MRVRGAGVILVMGIAAACGGRSVDSGDGWQGAEPSGTAGSNHGGASAGKSGGGSKNGSAGKPSNNPGTGATGTGATGNTTGGSASGRGGNTSTGGSSSAGGAPCLCPAIGCSPGYVHVADPKNCCGTCQLDCGDTGCSTIDLDCEPGMHVGKLPDECCPLCVPDDPLACDEGQQRYQELRSALLSKYQTGCSARGCVVFFESNRCSSTCGTPIASDVRDTIEERLGNFANQVCSACSKPFATPCAPSPAPVCVNDTCGVPPQ